MRTAAAALCAAAALASATPASAHGGGGDGRGVAIPAVSHGEMRVIAAHRGAILALAERRTPPDEAFRRTLNFARVQFAYCLWGLVPGTVTDEDSPFNECAHAYLSAAKALLSRMAGGSAEAAALKARIEAEVAASPPLVCAYGEEPFDTARTVYPRWSGAFSHPKTAMSGLSAAFALAASLCLGLALRRRPVRRA